MRGCAEPDEGLVADPSSTGVNCSWPKVRPVWPTAGSCPSCVLLAGVPVVRRTWSELIRTNVHIQRI